MAALLIVALVLGFPLYTLLREERTVTRRKIELISSEDPDRRQEASHWLTLHYVMRSRRSRDSFYEEPDYTSENMHSVIGWRQASANELRYFSPWQLQERLDRRNPVYEEIALKLEQIAVFEEAVTPDSVAQLELLRNELRLLRDVPQEMERRALEPEVLASRTRIESIMRVIEDAPVNPN